jgi:hypothetical protein
MKIAYLRIGILCLKCTRTDLRASVNFKNFQVYTPNPRSNEKAELREEGREGWGTGLG